MRNKIVKSLAFNTSLEEEKHLLEFAEKSSNFSGYLKRLLLEDLKNGGVIQKGIIDEENEKNPSFEIDPKHRKRLKSIWSGMHNRCFNPAKENFKYYGAKGIRVSDEWLDFKTFLEDMYHSYVEHVEEFGEKNTSLDRNDNEKGYSKENCSWATLEQQVSNKKRKVGTTYIYKNKSYSSKGLAEELGISVQTLHRRIKKEALDVTIV